MGAETVGTLVVVGVIVAVLALYVFLIGLGLRRLSFTLGTIIVGLRAIREQTKPVGVVLGGVLDDAQKIESALAGVLAAAGAGPAQETAPSMRDAVARARGDVSRADGEETVADQAAEEELETVPPRAGPRRPAGDGGASPMRQAVAHAKQRLDVR